MVSGSMLEKITVSSLWLAGSREGLSHWVFYDYHGPIFFPKMPEDYKDVTIREV